MIAAIKAYRQQRCALLVPSAAYGKLSASRYATSCQNASPQIFQHRVPQLKPWFFHDSIPTFLRHHEFTRGRDCQLRCPGFHWSFVKRSLATRRPTCFPFLVSRSCPLRECWLEQRHRRFPRRWDSWPERNCEAASRPRWRNTKSCWCAGRDTLREFSDLPRNVRCTALLFQQCWPFPDLPKTQAPPVRLHLVFRMVTSTTLLRFTV